MCAVTAGGVFTHIKEERKFENNNLSEYLRSNHPQTMKWMVLHAAGQGMGPLTKLLMSIYETGDNYPFKAFHNDVTFWQWLDQNMYENQVFDNAMISLDQLMSKYLVADYDFGKYDVIADIGGGKGALLQHILSKHANTTAILFDRPPVIDQARKHWNGSSLNSRLQFVAGDFFANVPSEANAYVLKAILHNWSDDDSISILKAIHKSIPSGRNATILIIENILGQPTWSPLPTEYSDIIMLTMFNSQEEL
jgi:hypothetical protein